MGAFKIQTDLDLSGFNLLNFCIQSYTDLENVPNLGLGRKLFFTGNSTDEKNLREVIWDGVEWKAAAYLDDIDKITNGEGSLGTRVKALEDMLKVDDANDVINTWAEIQEFLDQVQEGTDLMTMLDGKLDKTGGTISVSGYDGLTIASSAPGAAIKFKGAEATKGGYLIYGGGVDWRVSDDGWATSFKLIHSGNVGDYTAGAANRLANKVSLWGNEFDGTQSLNGSISFKDGDKLRSVLDYTSNSEFHLGYGTRTLNLTIWGTPIYFYANSTRAMTITEEGNVLVGNVAENEGTPLKVSTRIHVSGTNQTAPSLGSAPTSGLIVGTNALGINQWVNTSGIGNIQVGRFDGTATAYALNLNPLGGAVNVGGNLAPNANNSLSLGTSSYRWSNVYSVNGDFSNSLIVGSAIMSIKPADGTYVRWRVINNENGLYIQSGTYDGKATNGILNLTGIDATPLAKLNVKATVSSFSDRVLIGGAQDNTIYTLNVKGATSSQGIYSNFVYIGCGEDGTATGYGGEINRFGGANLYIQNRTPFTSVVFGDMEGTVNAVFRGAIGVAGLASFNGGALIPTGQTLTIGSVTIKEVATGEIEVDGNLHTTGTLASGGKATVGEGDNGGGGNANVYSDVLEGVITQEWEVGNPFQKEDVIVSLYMWNTDESRWEMVLADIGVTSENIWVTFGRPTSTTDKYMAVVMG